MAFKGKAPGSAAGEMSKRTEALRPPILLSPKEVQDARRMRREGMDPHAIAETLGKPMDEVEKALVQMRMPRPESTRGTLNITLAAHKVVLKERHGDEPLWQTFDRIIDELLRLRAQAQPTVAEPSRVAVRSRKRLSDGTGTLPLLD